MSFKNKVVLITGSGSGMGRTTAILFAKEGAHVVIVDFNDDAANKTAESCREYGNEVLVIKADVGNNDDIKKVMKLTIETFERLDVLVNNAGIMRRSNLLSGSIMDTYDQVMNVNLRAVVHMTSLASPYLVKTKGSIVNTSSIAGVMAQKGSLCPAYTISKAGVDSFTRLAAIELAPKGVRVNAVNPGPVYTSIMEHAGIDFSFQEISEATALGRVSDPEEVANLIMYLASDKAKGITGCSHLIDNGMALI